MEFTGLSRIENKSTNSFGNSDFQDHDACLVHEDVITENPALLPVAT